MKRIVDIYKRPYIYMYMIILLVMVMASDLMAGQNNKGQSAEAKAVRLQFADRAFGRHAPTVGLIHDKVLSAPDNHFRSPTYIYREGDRSFIFAGEGNGLDPLFNEALKGMRKVK